MDLLVVRGPSPIVIMRGDDESRAALLDDLIRATPDVGLGQSMQLARGADRHIDDEVQEVRHGVHGDDPYRHVVGSRYLRRSQIADVNALGPEGTPNRGVQNPTEGSDHVESAQHLTIMKCHTVAQVERPAPRILSHFPSLSQGWLIVAQLIQSHESLVNGIDDAPTGESVTHDMGITDRRG